MGKDGSHPGREQEKRQAKEILGFAHPIQINLFEEFHAHSDPLELDTNDHRFVPEIVLFLKIIFVAPTFRSAFWYQVHARLKAGATKCSVPPREASWPGANQR